MGHGVGSSAGEEGWGCFPVVSSESLYGIFSNPASSLKCVFWRSSPVPLEKHLVIEIIKANAGLFSPFDAVAVCWRKTSKWLLKKRLFQVFSCKLHLTN